MVKELTRVNFSHNYIRSTSLRFVALCAMLLLVCNGQTVKAVRDKSALYQKYPQLNSTDTDACVRGLSEVFINIRTLAPQQQMASTSLHGINDLGSMKECEHGTMADFASYSALKLNFTHSPISLISGICLPKECSQSQLTKFGDNTSILMNTVLRKVAKALDIFHFDYNDPTNWGWINPDTEFTITMTQSLNAETEWQDSVRIGFICAEF